jgi:nitronate monooxygenase
MDDMIDPNMLRLPVIAAPLFIISTPKLVLAQCQAGVIGTMPSLNARPLAQLDEWLAEITETLEANPGWAPFGINLIVHKSNTRVEDDLALCIKYRVPLIITSLGARADVVAAVHSYGGIVLHDVINQGFARKAIAKGADGLILVAAGAGGHAGALSPFAFLRETRAWFDGTIALSGAIAHGASILAARALGADFAYIGSPFIATSEARASDAYQQAIIAAGAEDLVYTDYFTGVKGNYLKASIIQHGLDPDHLPSRDPNQMDFGDTEPAGAGPKAWKDIWGAGQGIGMVKQVMPTAALIDRLAAEYFAAKTKLLAG